MDKQAKVIFVTNLKIAIAFFVAATSLDIFLLVAKQTDVMAFVFVTYHFILIPVLSLIVVGLIAYRSSRVKNFRDLVLCLSPLLIPISMAWFTLTGQIALFQIIDAWIGTA